MNAMSSPSAKVNSLVRVRNACPVVGSPQGLSPVEPKASTKTGHKSNSKCLVSLRRSNQKYPRPSKLSMSQEGAYQKPVVKNLKAGKLSGTEV